MLKLLVRTGMHVAIVFLFVTASFSVAVCQDSTSSLLSPDKKIRIEFGVGQLDKKSADSNQLYYRVSFKGKPLLNNSTMSLDIDGYKALGADVHIINAANSSVNQSYKLVTGKATDVNETYNTLQITLEENEAPKRKLIIEAKAYNDAVAFRYIVPVENTSPGYKLKNEQTEFHFSKDAITYAQVLPHYQSMYESEYLKLPVSAFSNQGGVKSSVLIGLPMLAEVPGVGWLAIAETDLQGYASMYLTNPSGGWSGHTMLSRLSPQLDSSGFAVTGNGDIRSAWRLLMIGDKPGKLVESNAIMNLSTPSAIKNTDWIKGGKASWDWWSGSLDANGKSAFTTDNMKFYVDFAAKSGLEYMLVDAGWSALMDITKMNGKVDIPELVKYAASKNVKVWIWLYGKAVMKQMEEAFPLYEKWGVAGLKIDFIERDDQAGIEFYYKTAKFAAEHHLMLDFHGCTKPFGLERTYPNVMNYEAVLGMEQSKGGSRDNPENHTMLPFTRMLTGPMDFTPGGFRNVTRDAFVAQSDAPVVMGTRAHHLALYVVYQAQFGMVSDYPAAYEGQRDFEFIKKVPATWDEIKVVNGLPGEYITVARRKGDDWYIGSITNWESRNLSIPLSFLGNGKYVAEIYADAADAGNSPAHTLITKQEVNSASVLTAKLTSGGGYAVRLVPVK